MSYDIIGDIHGHSRSLQALLERLGYRRDAGIYCRPSRKAIFLGDFIDRSTFQREVLGIVRPMIDSGAALAVKICYWHPESVLSYLLSDKPPQ